MLKAVARVVRLLPRLLVWLAWLACVHSRVGRWLRQKIFCFLLVPLSLADLTPAVLSRCLKADVVSVVTVPITNGVLSHCARLSVEYKTNSARLPARLVWKALKNDSFFTLFCSALFSIGEREHLVYSVWAEELSSLIGRPYFVHFSYWTQDFVLLMEDLGAEGNGGRYDDKYALSIRECELALIACAHLRLITSKLRVPSSAARIWPSPRDRLDLLLLPVFLRRVLRLDILAQQRDLAALFVSSDICRRCLEFAVKTDVVESILSSCWENPRWPGLSHGDARRENLFFDNNCARMIDFQLIEPRSPFTDLGVLIVHDFEIAVRRKEETRLLRVFLENSGTSNSEEEMWMQYRFGIVNSLVGMAFLLATCVLDEERRALTSVVVPRIVAACEDHRIDSFLEEFIAPQTAPNFC